ncbi:hypothetical protein F2Q69_00042771 [Brassica cretica]|uniref:Uncharacterized protein n=1 Tax=Brassica cretica TaxID=69181 RepID=A0A8S9NFQ0_BRACR|nr:hypothetical protein F2Q69_00042771 [Brassica cretica]
MDWCNERRNEALFLRFSEMARCKVSRRRLCYPKEGPLRVKRGGDLHSCTSEVVKVQFSLYGSSSPLSICFLALSVLSHHCRPESFCLELLFPDCLALPLRLPCPEESCLMLLILVEFLRD